MKGKLLSSADPARGRFRSLLLKSLKNFLVDASIKRSRKKRGGEVQLVSLHDMEPNPGNSSEPFSPEMTFDLAWAEAIAEEALRRLREECESKGKRGLYEALSPILSSDRGAVDYQKLSAQLEISGNSLKSLTHDFRKRFRTLIRDELRKTLTSDDDVEEEIRYLCAVLSTAAS